MKFIRDIIDSQQRLSDSDRSTDVEHVVASPPAVADTPNTEKDEFFELPRDFAVDAEEAPTAAGTSTDFPAFGEEPNEPDHHAAECVSQDQEEPEAPELDGAETRLTVGPFGETHDDPLEDNMFAEPSETAYTPMFDPDPSTTKVPDVIADAQDMTFRSSQHSRDAHVTPRLEDVAHQGLPLPLRERTEVSPALSDLAAKAPQLIRQSVESAPQIVKELPSQPSLRQATIEEPAPISEPTAVPAPAAGRGSGRGARAKTRLLGFNPAAASTDPLTRLPSREDSRDVSFPVGWLVVTAGPGRGASFSLSANVAQIGRAEGQAIRLDFGDNSISRENHAAVAYDAEQNAFFVGHGGKANLVRRNNRPVLSTEELSSGDTIRVGETTLRFVPLCGSDFSWNESQQNDQKHAVHG